MKLTRALSFMHIKIIAMLGGILRWQGIKMQK